MKSNKMVRYKHIYNNFKPIKQFFYILSHNILKKEKKDRVWIFRVVRILVIVELMENHLICYE